MIRAIDLKEQFWYLATPYSKYAKGLQAAFELACKAAAKCIKEGKRIYSPIAHTHPIAIHGGIDPYAHDIWIPVDRPFMEAAFGLIVVQAEGWRESKGILIEVEEFRLAKKPILYMPWDEQEDE